MDPRFDDRNVKPTPARLSKALGRTQRHWDEIVAHAEKACEGLVREWKFYGKKHGWQHKLLFRKRALLYMVPRDGCFTTGMALNDKAVAALRDSKLPPGLVAEIEGAKKWPEGRPARVRVTNLKHVGNVKKLITAKLAT